MDTDQLRGLDVSTTRTSDRGAALILTMVWSAVLLMLAGVVSTAVLRQVRPSDQAEQSFQAWAAAEAGVEDVRSRLAANGEYWKSIAAYYADPVANAAVATANPALAGWVDLPGGASDAQFTYYVDTSAAARSGRITISAAGRTGAGASEQLRVVEAQVLKRTTNEYAYLSNSETFPYDAPGVYGPPGETSKDGKKMSITVAEALCGSGGSGGNHLWFEWTDWMVNGTPLAQGPVATVSAKNPTITNYGPHKNSVACLHGSVQASDRWVGPVHTNDVWYLDPSIPNIDPNIDSGLSTQVFKGRVTSSCPEESAGSAANTTCRENHRWISTATLPGESNLGTDPRYSAFILDEIPNNAAENGKLWNPDYDSPVEMPSDAMISVLKGYAASDGCIFSGPTRVRMTTVAGAGKLVITSPDTVDTAVSSNAFCGGTALYATDPKNQPTITLDYATLVAQGFNGVIYVEDSPLLSAAPSCQPKRTPPVASQSTYPWVIPQASSETITLTTGTPRGFPSADTRWVGNLGPSGVYDEWTDNPTSMCWKGHVYLQASAANGGYTGQYTLGADGDIIITDDVYESTVTNFDPSSPGWGVPDADSTNQLGLVMKRWLYVYHLAEQKGGSNNGVSGQLRDLLLNFSILAPNKCLTVQDYNSVPQMNDLKVVGSIGQDSRCRITDPSSGYDSLFIEYDERLARLGPPPFMAELSQEPWKVKAWSETNVRRDAEAKTDIPAVVGTQTKGTTKDFDVLSGTPTGTRLLFARVLSGVGTAQTNGDEVRYLAPNGVTQTILEFVVEKPDGMRVGQTLTVNVS